MDDSKEIYGPEPATAKIVEDFIYSNQEIINSLPKYIYNNDSTLEEEFELQFNNKLISGINIFTLPLLGHPNYTPINNLINLMDTLKHLVRIII